MSNRYSQGRQDGNKGIVKAQKKFVPKTSNFNPKGSNSNPTLSNSLRQSDAPVGSNVSVSSSTTSTILKGDNGEWVSNRTQCGNFVNYLPQDEAVAAGLSAEEGGLDAVESQRVVNHLNRELSRLLKLNPREFWREVASDTSLHEFLDSFLQFRSRWYDFPHRGAKGIVAGVIVGELELSRRVFMLLYRISSNKDPGAQPTDSLSLKDHEVLLQEKRLLDLPTLFDICAIYGHENEELTRLLVQNALIAQPWIHDNLSGVISHFLGIVHTMHERCGSSLEVLFSSGKPDDHNATQLQANLLEVMDFINDAVVSMDAFVSAYKPAAIFFSCPAEMSYGNEELINLLAKLHDALLPSLQKGFHVIFAGRQDGGFCNVVVSLKMLRTRLVKLGWQLLHICYLSDEVFRECFRVPSATKMFPANVEDPVIRADVLVQTFREVNAVSVNFPESPLKETFLQHIEQNGNILRRIEKLRDCGWIVIDDEQFQYISGIISSPKEIHKEPPPTITPAMGNTSQMDEDAAIVESKISQIRDLFPDYGKGFLAACLEVYDQNPEDVIQRILEGTLHEDLQCLDTSLETVPPMKATSVNRNDKGKGKLYDSVSASSNNAVIVNGNQQIEGPLISSSASLGKFVRKSKADSTDVNILDKKDERDTSKTAALVSQYEYEDEYDDSFDDLGLSVADSGIEENEILDDKANENLGKVGTTETGHPPQNVANSKWGSRKKPQYYVKDGKNYSYKVAGAVAVANSDEASLVTQAQGELIYGLGRGGNFPLGAVKKLTDSYKDGDNQIGVSEMQGRGVLGKPGGRGRKERGKPVEPNEEQEKQSEILEMEGRGSNYRGRGRRGGGRSNHYRKDQAMKKHFSGLGGY